MTRDELLAQLQRLAPFHHNVALPHGLSTIHPEVAGLGRDRPRRRVERLKAQIWEPMLQRFGGSLGGLRILDVACNCGGFSFEAANSGASEVLGIDVTERYIEQARFLREVLAIDQVRFENISLDDLTSDLHGVFDIVFLFGILYHLENPVASMRKIASLTGNTMIIDTALVDDDTPVWLMNFPGKSTAETITTSLWRSDDTCQFTPSGAAVEQLLRFLGFTVEFIGLRRRGGDPSRPRVVRGSFIATRMQ